MGGLLRTDWSSLSWNLSSKSTCVAHAAPLKEAEYSDKAIRWQSCGGRGNAAPSAQASRSGPTAALRHRGRTSGLAHSPALPGGGRTSFAALDNALLPCPSSASSTNWPTRSPLAFRRSQELGILTVTRELVCLLFHPRRPLSVRLVVCRKRGRGRKNPEQFWLRRSAMPAGCTRGLTPYPAPQPGALPASIPRLALSSLRPRTPQLSPNTSLPNPTTTWRPPESHWADVVPRMRKLPNKPPARMLSGQMTDVLLESALFTVTCSPIVA